MHSRAFGQSIEELALEFFLRAEPRARLVARNYRQPWGEIDLIFCVGERDWVFVEVRARVGRDGGGPMQSGVESVDGRKLRRLLRTIRSFLWERELGPELSGELRLEILDWDGRGFSRVAGVI